MEVKNFLSTELHLELSESKTLITNLSLGKVSFLGTSIARARVNTYGRKSRNFLIRDNKTLRLTAPIDSVIKKLTAAGIIKNGKPIPRWKWLANTKDEIILLYNSVYRGITNYYSFANNLNQLSSRVRFILLSSCAKTLAAKFTLGTQAAVFKKFGKNLKGNDKHPFAEAVYGIKPWNFRINLSVPLLKLYAKGISKANLDNLVCAKCESNYRVEMHHIRMLKDLNPKLNMIDATMAKRRRKQIPLCRQCHMEYHANPNKKPSS